MSAAETVKRIRITLCLEQEKLAREIKVTKQTVSNYETGKRKPKLSVIKKIMDLAKKNDISVKVEDFFE